jgi:hypothetical protein
MTADAGQGAFRLHYMDDSGSATSGLASFTWLQMPPTVWATARQAWLGFREDLNVRHGIAPAARLHASGMVSGNENPSSRLGWDVRRHAPGIIREALEVIAGIAGVTVGTVYRNACGTTHSAAKSGLYRDLVVRLDDDLRREGMSGMVFMDGRGTEPFYSEAHQALSADRHLLEEPVFRLASQDQWVQMADLAAWTAFQSLHRRKRGPAGISSWYQHILSPIDVFGGPLAL